MPIQKITCTGGMDSDSADELIMSGFQRFRLNVRVVSSETANVGAVEDVLGNTLVPYTLPAGVNVCIGSYEDIRFSNVYFFVFNSLNNHTILQYSISANSIAQVVIGSFLNFNTQYLITGINVIEVDPNTILLYWTDNFNEPKKINIQKGIYWSQGNYILGYPTAIFNPEWIMRIKQPPLIQPAVVYGSDETKNTNFLSNQLFQFKSTFIYDDFEQSAWSPISITPYPVPSNTTLVPPVVDNYISVSVPTGNEIVQRILISARLFNTGDFFQIADLNKSDLNILNNSNYAYSFYNDKIYNSIDIDQSDKLFDLVPLLSQSQEIIKGDRLVDGNITEGYSPVAIDAQIDLNLNTKFGATVFNVTGTVYIKAPLNPVGYGYSASQPIYVLGSTAMFGGINPSTNSLILSVSNPGVYGQTIPAKGFIAYLAGTKYYAVSVQTIATSSNLPDIQTEILNIQNTLSSGISFASVFTIQNVPAGTYILRFADHRTTTGQLNSGNLDWQNMSTNVLYVGGQSATECELTIDSSGNVTIAGVVYPNNTPTGFNSTTTARIPDSGIADLMGNSQSSPLSTTTAITGYVIDNDISTSPVLINPRIDLAHVIISNPYINANQSVYTEPEFIYITNQWSNGIAYTDHNGYFFYSQQVEAIGSLPPNVSGVSIAGTNINVASYAIDGSAWIPPNNAISSAAKLFDGIFQNINTNTNNLRTKITGSILYDNIAIQGYAAIVSRGNWAYTDSLGNYTIIVYADTFAFDNTGLVGRVGVVLFGTGDNSTATFTPRLVTFFLPIGVNTGSAPPYNFLVPFVAGTTAVTSVLGSGVISAEKRGAFVEYGIVYYDHGNRSGLTNLNDYDSNVINQLSNKYGTRLYIPFYNELNAQGVTYGGAYPIIGWDIFNLPPSWATHYQWVKFRPVKRYVQFCAQTIQYLDASNNAVAFSQNPVKIKIDVSNILDFARLNQGSIIKYTYAVGDRIRFIKDSVGNPFNNYYDFPINGVDTTTGTLLYCNVLGNAPNIANGVVFEIWNPSPVSDVTTQIYYEFGETYDIGLDANGVRIHLGQNEDQKVWNFDDNNWTPNGVSFVSYSGVAHNFIVGDKIRITQSPGFTWASYNTYAIVTAIPNIFQVITNLPFAGNSPANPGQIVSSANGVFSTGDTFYRLRNMPFNFTANGAFVWIEDQNFSDLYISNSVDIGRANRYDPTYKQVTRLTTVYFSEVLVPETKINGLSSVFDVSFQSYDLANGSIQKLFYDGQILEMYQELKCGYIPIDQIIFNAPPSGQQVVGAAENVLSPQAVYYEGMYGIGKNPESFAHYGGAKYGVDVKRGVAWRLSRNGLSPISRLYKQNIYFMNACRSIVSSGRKVNIYGVFDVKFDEYIISFSAYNLPVSYHRISAIPIYIESTPIPADTLAFNEKENVWSCHYSYNPENMCSAGINIVTFLNGQLWLHNTNPLYNNFYGVQYYPELWITGNDFPSDKKVFQAIALECQKGWNATIITPNGQASNIEVADFQNKEDYLYAALGMDTNTPNVVDPWINGDPLRDNTILIKLTYPGTDYVKLFAVNILFRDSPRSNK